MSEYANEIPDESEQLDQLEPQRSLVDRGVDDVLDEGYSPPERYSQLIREGEHETLDERLEEDSRATRTRLTTRVRSSTTGRSARSGPAGWSTPTKASGRMWMPTWSATMSESTAEQPALRRLRSTCQRQRASFLIAMPKRRGTDPLYPPIEPYARGMLDVGDGHQIYWEECGNPSGNRQSSCTVGPGEG